MAQKQKMVGRIWDKLKDIVAPPSRIEYVRDPRLDMYRKKKTKLPSMKAAPSTYKIPKTPKVSGLGWGP